MHVKKGNLFQESRNLCAIHIDPIMIATLT